MFNSSKYTKTFTFFGPPKDRVEHFQTHSKIRSEFWDPADNFEFETVTKNCAKLRAEFEKLQKNPARIKKYDLIWKIVAICLIIFGIFLTIITGEFDFLIIFSIVGVMPYLLFLGHLRSISVDLIKLQIAEDNNWAYDPDSSTHRWRNLMSKYSQIFFKGSSSQDIEDQFWGNFEYKNKVYPFHAGLFSYAVQHGRSSTTYHTNYFAVKMNSKQKSSFYLYPETKFSKFSNLFSKKEINTESIEFNKTFAFSYKGKKDEHALNIIKALSPAVQQKLLDLKNKKGSIEILFKEDTFLVLFKGVLLPSLKTDFSKSLEVNKADVEQINNELKKVLDISTEMLHYIS